MGLPLLMALLAAAGVMLIVWALLGARGADPVHARLTQLGTLEGVSSLEEIELQQPVMDRTIRPLIGRLSGLGSRLTSRERIGRTELRLAEAGYPFGLRTVDFVARWGGEEFVFLLPETPLRTAATVLNRIRRAIAVEPVSSIGRAVTASFGVTRLSRGEHGDAALERADAGLYESKRNGRNRVTAKSPRSAPPGRKASPSRRGRTRGGEPGRREQDT